MDNEVAKNTKLNTLKPTVNKIDEKTCDATTLSHINQYNIDKHN